MALELFEKKRLREMGYIYKSFVGAYFDIIIN